MSKYYLTTAIPYVNAKPHVGHALEFVQADTIARFKKLQGNDVCFLSGSDENALKNVEAASKAGKPVQEFIDENAQKFLQVSKALDVQFDFFQKGSDRTHHFPACQKLWELCANNGDIYKKSYEGLYCVGCELFYSREELDEKGECFEHPGKTLTVVSEENYFFRLSKYQDQIINLITTDQLEIVPAYRKNEMLAFLKSPLLDISISRSQKRAKNWGVDVPGDPTQKMYVWFDALNIYQSGVGFGSDLSLYEKWWPADLHVIGKGINRFHAIYWPAFLLSAKLKLPKKIFVHGYFTVNGQKMSKTVGNVVDPMEVIRRYGVDFARFYFLSEVPTFDDGDFSFSRADELYTSAFANGLGNLVSRVSALCGKTDQTFDTKDYHLSGDLTSLFDTLDLRAALVWVWKDITLLDKEISEGKPWELDASKLQAFLVPIVDRLRQLSVDLEPFMPSLSEKLQTHFLREKIGKITPLFPRLEALPTS